MAEPETPTRLPENAYRELKPGEEYVPMIPPTMTVPELTGRMYIFGLLRISDQIFCWQGRKFSATRQIRSYNRRHIGISKLNAGRNVTIIEKHRNPCFGHNSVKFFSGALHFFR